MYIMAPVLIGNGDSGFIALSILYRALFFSMRERERKSEMGFFFFVERGNGMLGYCLFENLEGYPIIITLVGRSVFDFYE
ncbi:hypothetical protein OIU79_012900 [Salix purpurea]|uniref:Uncharacterized protein n=1 Tax=Salix purpurea TaxID=77065 RepID=A0A9Q0T377_SALPP|nr:hypothetical protein OIU79_012900 [Salix purpurea]